MPIHLSETGNCPQDRKRKMAFLREVPVVSLIYSGGEGAETEYTGRYQICLRLWKHHQGLIEHLCKFVC